MRLCVHKISRYNDEIRSPDVEESLRSWKMALAWLYSRHVSMMRLAPFDMSNDRSHVRRTLDSFSESECYISFRFTKSDILRLMRCFHVPDDVWIGRDRSKALHFRGDEIFPFFLHRLAYPNRLSEMAKEWGRDYSAWSKAFKWMVLFFAKRWHHLLTDLRTHHPHKTNSIRCALSFRIVKLPHTLLRPPVPFEKRLVFVS